MHCHINKNMPDRQTGSALLETLIAMVIFSVAILGLIGLQGRAIQFNADAKFRTDAMLLVSEYLAEMRTANLQTLVATYGHAAAGTGYTTFRTRLRDFSAAGKGLPCVDTTVTCPNRAAAATPNPFSLATLPAGKLDPQVSAVATNNAVTGLVDRVDVQIAVFWMQPQETTIHQHIVQAVVAP